MCSPRPIALAVLCFAVATGGARAEIEDPDTQAARRRFDEGLAAYDAGRYDEALGKFEAARALRPTAAFDYNIGRCQERLERWGDAAASFERFLAAAPPDAASAAVHERVAVLRARAAPRPDRRLRHAAIALAAVTVATGATWAGLFGSVGAEYHDRLGPCGGACTEDSVSGLRARQQASYAFAAIAASALVADVVIWVVDARRRRASR